MSWSLGEIGALSTKAARGCGMDWGLADEAGYAVKWLQRRQLPGIAALCLYLSWRQTGDITVWPDLTGDTGHYCPIATGASYGDGVFADEVEFSRIRMPLLLIPFVALCAGKTPITISFENVVFNLSKDGFAYSSNDTAMLIAASHCRISTKIDQVPQLRRISDTDLPRVPETASACVTVLNSFAKNTYAPATEASRLRGAGSGLSDND